MEISMGIPRDPEIEFKVDKGRLVDYWGDQNVERLVIPDGIHNIDSCTFNGLKQLKEVIVPDSVTKFCINLFFGCDSLQRITVSAHHPTYRSIDGVLYTKDRKEMLFCPPELEEITLPENLLRAGRYAFWVVRKLHVIRLHPDDLAISRPYYDIRRDLGERLKRILRVIRKERYREDAVDDYTVALLLQHYYRTRGASVTGYVRLHIREMMMVCLQSGATPLLEAFAEDKMFTKEIIDEFLVYTQEQNMTEEFMILLNYKNKHFGFSETGVLRL